MLAFWRNGYAATSISELTETMGIAAPSLYAAFGDKESLFREAIARYEEGHGAMPAQILAAEPTARSAIERLLLVAAERLTAPGRPTGCMVALAAANCPAEATKVSAELATKRAGVVRLIRDRIEEGQRSGDASPELDAQTLSDFFVSVYFGMSLRARDGATREDLTRIAAMAMRVWPA